MLASIEDKLSAIKAINESIEQIEHAIEDLSADGDLNKDLLSPIALSLIQQIQAHADLEIAKVAMQEYLQQKAELVSKATQLMR